MTADRFFIIGAQRSATTALYEALDAHPSIVMARPRRPEPKHFLRSDATEPGRLRAYNRDCFGHQPAARWRGEKSTAYIEVPEAAARIASAYSDAYIIVVLREPVRRAMSNYAFSVENGLEHRPIEVALLPGAELPHTTHRVATSPFDYLGRSRYVEHLRPWFALFPDDQRYVTTTEELVDPNRAELDRLARFLDLAPPGLRPLAPDNESATTPRLPDALEDQLREYFAPMNAALEQLLGRSLECWSTPRLT